jgi:hypothetical protein
VNLVKPTLVLSAVALFALVTVEFGGWSLLGMLTRRNGLTPFQEQFFRAGHAHAGALLVLSLVFFVLLRWTSFGVTTQWVLGFGLLLGMLLQSGGFFLHMLLGSEDAASIGTQVTRVGAVVLAAALVTLGVGLLRAAGTAAAVRDTAVGT